MRFIDLFAGLGGFHVALEKLGHECVFASEKKENLALLYEKNFGIKVDRDITKVDITKIPSFDILCGGFPCQPFSKAGDQKGLEDEKNGNLFNNIADILDYHSPDYVILENVRNLETHDNFNTWNYIKRKLQDLGYIIDKKILSPHKFGIPQHRERVFIVGSKNGLKEFEWPKEEGVTKSIESFLDKNPKDAIRLELEKVRVLDIWQEFVNKIPSEDKLPGFPIWSMEFGADYPYEEEIPFRLSSNKLARHKGAFGVELKGGSRSEKFDRLPNYVKKNQLDSKGKPVLFPKWKINYIKHNRRFYNKYKTVLGGTIKKIQKLNVSSWQKFEWNIQGGERDLSKYIIQFRGSGVRVKKTDFFPSLVTVSTQIPIIGWEKRYLTPREGARIQCLDNIELPETNAAAFSALGNAVNVKLVSLIAENLLTDSSKQEIGLKVKKAV